MTTNIAMIQELEFLRESNAIEGVYDLDSFVQAMHAWDYLRTLPKISHSVVCKTHKILMAHHALQPNHRGHYRDVMVTVGGRPGAQVHMIKPLMDDWIADANAHVRHSGPWTPNLEPITDHIRFEKIHPFVDGNGRLGRMLMNWQYLQLGEPIKVFTEDKKQDYYRLFE